uniref:PDZ domain-containing protein n=1 Tax=Panagrolaimus sp. JU765 TaxID=591449 RepID=A0AC34Q411_9BILA
MNQLPPNIEKIIKRHAGFQYSIVNIKYVPKTGRIFGLQIANVTSHKIIVPDVADKSVAGDYLKPLDHIVAINGVPVSSVEIARRLIKECKACFQAVIERPISLEALSLVRKEVEEWRKKMNKPAAPKNMEEMPLDVQEIVSNLLQKRQKTPPVPKHPSALRKVSRAKSSITFTDKHCETQIQSDVAPNKVLRSCK